MSKAKLVFQCWILLILGACAHRYSTDGELHSFMEGSLKDGVYRSDYDIYEAEGIEIDGLLYTQTKAENILTVKNVHSPYVLLLNDEMVNKLGSDYGLIYALYVDAKTLEPLPYYWHEKADILTQDIAIEIYRWRNENGYPAFSWVIEQDSSLKSLYDYSIRYHIAARVHAYLVDDAHANSIGFDKIAKEIDWDVSSIGVMNAGFEQAFALWLNPQYLGGTLPMAIEHYFDALVATLLSSDDGNRTKVYQHLIMSLKQKTQQKTVTKKLYLQTWPVKYFLLSQGTYNLEKFLVP